jgi:excisionase family DNA binding protein
MLGVSRVRAYQLVKEGRVPAVRLPQGRIKIPRAAWEAWVEEQNERALANLAP